MNIHPRRVLTLQEYTKHNKHLVQASEGDFVRQKVMWIYMLKLSLKKAIRIPLNTSFSDMLYLEQASSQTDEVK